MQLRRLGGRRIGRRLGTRWLDRPHRLAATGPTGPTGPVTGGTPGSDAWAIGERLDTDPECDGLLPDHLPDPVFLAPTLPHLSCGPAFTDGTGHLAIASSDPTGFEWQAMALDGTLGHAFGADQQTSLVNLPSGWANLASTRVPPFPRVPTVVNHETAAPDGSILSSTLISGDTTKVENDTTNLGEDPAGGSIASVSQTELNGDGTMIISGQRFDASGAPLWPASKTRIGTVPPPASTFLMANGVSTAGESLSLWGAVDTYSLAWRDRGGATVAEASGKEPLSALLGDSRLSPFFVEVRPLLDGSVVLRVENVFRRAFGHLATTSSPLPPWLAVRANQNFRVTRGGKGYVAMPPPVSPTGPLADCQKQLELLAPSGRLCARITLHGLLVNSGLSCTVGDPDQGWDGTVVQKQGATRCGYIVWPRMLAK